MPRTPRNVPSRSSRLVALALGFGCAAGCAPPPFEAPSEDEPPVDGPQPLSTVVAAPPPYGGFVEVGPLVMLGPPAALDGAVHLQDPEGRWGIEVARGGLLDGWPPPVGTELDLRLVWTGSAAQPVAYLTSWDNVLRIGEVGEPVVADDPESPAPYTLVRHTDITVASWVDPTGRADLLRPGEVAVGELGLLDAFGVGLPPAGNRGDLLAIALPNGRRAPRWREDWTGGWEEATRAPATVEEIVAGVFADGTAVEVSATQAAPWSDGGGSTVIQGIAAGLWVHADGLAGGAGGSGEVGIWRGEVRTDRGARVLRVWDDREAMDLGPTLPPSALPVDGVAGAVLASQVAPPDLLGERAVLGGDAAGVVLDDRFVRLDAMPDPAWVEGIWEVRPDAPARLCVLSAVAPDALP
jgi:hypothetical protein